MQRAARRNLSGRDHNVSLTPSRRPRAPPSETGAARHATWREGLPARGTLPSRELGRLHDHRTTLLSCGTTVTSREGSAREHCGLFRDAAPTEPKIMMP